MLKTRCTDTFDMFSEQLITLAAFDNGNTGIKRKPKSNSKRITYPDPEANQIDLLDILLGLKSEDTTVNGGNTFTWGDSDILAMREALLLDSLRVFLDARTGRDTKEDVAGWMMSDDMHPFCFTLCCESCLVCPQELREKVKDLVVRVHKRIWDYC
ncbi:hypothetical protein GCM10023116_15330 [Kistimonas scapharcae]|uniref:Uncharacterized protein n=1 Tax=Kistimonas scapharcae TaxID=1036133 RepID=A0ABP8V1G6_9GAMM